MEIINSENYVDVAEKVIKSMKTTDKWGNEKIALSTSKIRNILSMISGLYNDVVMLGTDKLSAEYVSRIKYIKMRFAYEAGREKTVKEFIDKANIFKIMDSIKDSTDNLILFCNYMEALVAYHKFYGGSDK
ncbi:type III-A CRISPR-associated protein Csm2 [Falcatimonas sp. MSJ-15]|uniref:type III-A CRISPR-associated protein Csm2 n=1 Tax=Falcatimonas sp. MSJ-15 TaxID=2841515 RepID=UPI001C0F9EA6|nr:type III-A CRISPR-associated protein Csm2 [Falcatimonas sp. MSJ-15]MBU5470192.1 type III-A CRISPR-associated protein Csm2 [Falcatimonas sp. MSJ-15]